MMATRPISPEQMLSAIPSLPRPMLARLVDHMIERLDELDDDADLEDGGDTAQIDEREPDEKFGFSVSSLVASFPPPLSGHKPATWRLSIATRARSLEIEKGFM